MIMHRMFRALFVTVAVALMAPVQAGVFTDVGPFQRASKVRERLDAMAQGKAIVQTRIGAEGIRIDPGTHYVAADQPREFIDAVVRLLGDAQERARLGRAARERAEQEYSWAVLGRRLHEVYTRAATSARAGAPASAALS